MVIAGLALRYGGRRMDSTHSTSDSGPTLSSVQRRISLATIVAIGCVMAVRVAMSPLTGFDTIFRWDFLAKQILAEENLDFYPPMTSEDYNIYVFPDGIAPVVSTVYWWLYAAWCRPEPAVTLGFVLIQWAVARSESTADVYRRSSSDCSSLVHPEHYPLWKSFSFAERARFSACLTRPRRDA